MYFLRSGIPFVRFLIIFMCGLFVGIYYPMKLPKSLVFASIAMYLFLYYFKKKHLYLIFAKSFFAFFILFLMGIILVNRRTEKNELRHFTHFLDSIECYKARIVSAPEYTEKTIKIVLEIKDVKTFQSGWQPTCGKMLAYIQKDSSFHFQKGAVFLISGKPSPPTLTANPEQFDYANYLNRQNIYAVHFIRKSTFMEIGCEKDFFILQIADAFRSFCDEKLKVGIKGENEYRMASALLLGVRAGLDEKLYEAYSATGTVHALAVSGLHVSLIYFIVVTLFGFLKKIKYGKFIFATLSILIFWFYALVTGFSPSVVRAVAMFSVFLAAGILKRNSGIYNTLGFSAFVILCFEPFWLLDIGFQFSFLAVVGIAYIYPILYCWLESKNKIGNKLWSLVCVSLAAQIAVSPISIYYFHSFPLLFLPFNMLIVPLSSLALYTGLGGLMVYKIKMLADFLFLLTEYIVRFMNYFVQLPSGSEFLKADFLYLNPVELILIYLFITFLFFSFKNKNYKSFVYSFFFLFFFVFSTFYNSILKNKKDTFALYSVKDKTVLSLINGGNALIFSDSILSDKSKVFRYNIYNHLAAERIKSVSFMAFKDATALTTHRNSFGQLFVWQGMKILRIEKGMGEELTYDFLNEVDIIIVSSNQFYNELKQSKINVKPLILIDSSVKGEFVEGTTSYYDVRERGAYVY